MLIIIALNVKEEVLKIEKSKYRSSIKILGRHDTMESSKF